MKILSLSLSFFLLAASAVLALDTSQITYPIVELGNCPDQASCKTYCSQPANYATCKTFAASRQEKTVAEAKNFLGCTTYEGCKTFCQNTANKEKCREFSQRASQVSPDIIAAFYQATREELGCDSQNSCKIFCDQIQNRERCILFAKRHNLFRPKPLLMPASPSAVLKPARPPLYPPATSATPAGQNNYYPR